MTHEWLCQECQSDAIKKLCAKMIKQGIIICDDQDWAKGLTEKEVICILENIKLDDQGG